VSFSHSAQHHTHSVKQTEDSMMPMPNSQSYYMVMMMMMMICFKAVSGGQTVTRCVQ